MILIQSIDYLSLAARRKGTSSIRGTLEPQERFDHLRQISHKLLGLLQRDQSLLP